MSAKLPMSLFEAIASAPDDDAPRLSLLAWLADHGDPRADLVRAQLELAGLPEHSARAGDLRASISRFTANPTKDPWPELLPGVTKLGLERGLPFGVHVPVERWPAIAAEVCRLLPIRRLALYLPRGRLGSAASGPWLARITDLSVGPALSDDDLSTLLAEADLRSLRRLDLSQNPLTDAGMAALSGWGGRGQLETLELAGTRIGPAGLEALARAGGWDRLTTLNLYRCAVGPRGAIALASLRGVGSGSSFRLAQVAIGDDGCEALVASAQAAGWRELTLDRCSVGSRGLAAIARAPTLAGLRVLRLPNNFVGDEGARAVAGSTTLTALESLDLTSNDVREAGARVLADAQLGSLREVLLVGNPLYSEQTEDWYDQGVIVGSGLRRLDSAEICAKFGGLVRG